MSSQDADVTREYLLWGQLGVFVIFEYILGGSKLNEGHELIKE